MTEMSLIFKSRPGVVVRMDDSEVSQCSAFFRMDEPSISYDEQKAIITGFGMGGSVNAQFMHTLGAAVYIYVFGDRIGNIELTGLSFCTCDNVGAVGGDEIVQRAENGVSSHGGSLMYEWYKRYRTAKRAEPIRLAIGESVLEGFITRFNQRIIEPSQRVAQWTVEMVSLPEDDA